MVTWNTLWLFALPALVCWTVAALVSLRGGKKGLVYLLTVCGLLIFG